MPCRSATKDRRFFLLVDAMRCIILFYSLLRKSKRSSAVDSSYAICAYIAWFLALFPPLDVTVGSACILLFFFSHFLFFSALKDVRQP